MTKLKPTISLSTMKEPTTRNEMRSKKLAECQTTISKIKKQLELMSYAPRISFDSSAGRSDDDLRTESILGVDGKNRMHQYRAEDPAGTMRCVPPIYNAVGTQTVEKRGEVKQLTGRPRIRLSEVSMVCLPPSLPLATEKQEEQQIKGLEKEEGSFFTPPEDTPLAKPMFHITLTGNRQNCPIDNSTRTAFDFKRLQTRLCSIQPLTLPFISMFIMPQLVNGHLILFWFIGKALRVLQNKLPPMFETALWPMRKIRTATTVAGEVLMIWAMLNGSLEWATLLPWKALLGIYVLWTIIRSAMLTRSGERNVLLTRLFTLLCVLPAFTRGGLTTWLAWKVAGMFVQLLDSLLTFGSKVSVAVMVMAVAYGDGVS